MANAGTLRNLRACASNKDRSTASLADGLMVDPPAIAMGMESVDPIVWSVVRRSTVTGLLADWLDDIDIENAPVSCGINRAKAVNKEIMQYFILVECRVQCLGFMLYLSKL